MDTLTYDAVVVGAGPGGYPCAIRLGQLGVKTLCIERENWGGVCLNVGCIPSKALITAGRKYEEARHNFDEMGIVLGGAPTLDMGKLQAWKGSIVKRLTGGVSTLLKANKVDQLVGEAKAIDPHTLEVTKPDGTVVRVQAKHVVLATGSRPIEIPGFSFKDEPVMDSTKALALAEVPRRLVVIGGGYIGLELGQMLNKVGAEVTVVEAQDSLLPGFDPEVTKLVARACKKSGIRVVLQAKALGWEQAEDGVVVRIQTAAGEERLAADKILVTVGRRPNAEPWASALGLQVERGQIVVDKQLRTSVPGVYAIGDVASGVMLATRPPTTAKSSPRSSPATPPSTMPAPSPPSSSPTRRSPPPASRSTRPPPRATPSRSAASRGSPTAAPSRRSRPTASSRSSSTPPTTACSASPSPAPTPRTSSPRPPSPSRWTPRPSTSASPSTRTPRSARP